MHPTSEQDKRLALGSELADIATRQAAVVNWNPILGALLSDEKAREEWGSFLVEDEKNLRMMETLQNNFGVRVEPKDFTRRLTELVDQKIRDPQASLLEKLGAYSLVKQAQILCGHLVHKSTQLAQTDVKEALGMFEGVQAAAVKQMAEINKLVESIGVEMIMGEAPATGVTARIRDAAATVAGAVLSKTAKPADEMSILNVLRMDHMKAKTLVQEIMKANDPLDKNDLFYQLKMDLTSHSEAEEETVYKHYMNYSDISARFQEADDEHEELRRLLEGIANLDPASEQFRLRMGELKQLLNHHIDEEEHELFRLMKEKSDEQELNRLSQDFSQLKAQIQERLSPRVIDRSIDGTSPSSQSTL